MKIYGNDGNLIFGEQNAEILAQNSNILEVKLSNGDIYRVNVVGSNADDVYADNIEVLRLGTEMAIGDKLYKTVKIGDRIWMAENLEYTIGDSKYYDNDKITYGQLGKHFGCLYSWDDAKSISIPGWHLPTQTEINDLMNSVGGSSIAGKALKSKEYWKGSSGPGDDSFGFTAYPAGSYSGGEFKNVNYNAYFWTATSVSDTNAVTFNLLYNYESASMGSAVKTFHSSVRLVKD